MTFEVMGTEVGCLRLRDLRGAFDGSARPGATVGVLVVGIDGGPPFIGAVTLARKRSGHSAHVALLCPSCRRPRTVLHLRGGSLACAGCTRVRTRRQSERTLASWRRGGREEDRLLRSVGRGCATPILSALVNEIIDGDYDRASVVFELFASAMACNGGTDVDV